MAICGHNGSCPIHISLVTVAKETMFDNGSEDALNKRVPPALSQECDISCIPYYPSRLLTATSILILKKSFTPLFSFPNEIPARKMHENVN
jgi:hypothetical protein